MRIKKKGLIVFPDEYNPILEYAEQIEDGKIIVSEKIKQVIKKLVHDISSDHDDYIYDNKQAHRPITFIENFIYHYKGAKVGEPFYLDLWQRVIIASTFGFVHNKTGFRKYKELLLIIGRKNGKSALASAIALYLLFADGEAAPNIVSVATMKDQAKIIWETSKRYINRSEKLKEYAKTLVSSIETEFNDGIFKPLASQSDTLDGLDVSGVFIDELHAIKDKNLYDVVVDGMSARRQPLSIITTTSGIQRNGIYDLKYEEAKRILNGYFDEDGYKDDTILPFVFELDNPKEWRKEKNWEKANPGLGSIKNKDILAEKVHRAKHNPLLVNNLLTKEFNVPANSDNAWLTFVELNNETTIDIDELRPSYAIGGVDLSKTTDLTAATVMFKISGDENLYFESMYWLPANVIDKREQEDKVPYHTWVQQGYLRLSEGDIVNYSDVTKWFYELQDKYDLYTLWVGYDAWSASYFVAEMNDLVGEGNMIPIRQGAKTLSQPMQQLGAKLKSKKVIYNNNPITKWNISNTHVVMDNNGNIKPTKARNGERQRIDGLAAMLNAYTVYLAKENEYEGMI